MTFQNKYHIHALGITFQPLFKKLNLANSFNSKRFFMNLTQPDRLGSLTGGRTQMFK